MATITICDICGRKPLRAVRVTVVERHPHDGAKIDRAADLCTDCLPRVRLYTHGPLPKIIASK